MLYWGCVCIFLGIGRCRCLLCCPSVPFACSAVSCLQVAWNNFSVYYPLGYYSSLSYNTIWFVMFITFSAVNSFIIKTICGCKSVLLSSQLLVTFCSFKIIEIKHCGHQNSTTIHPFEWVSVFKLSLLRLFNFSSLPDWGSQQCYCFIRSPFKIFGSLLGKGIR